MEPVLFGDTGLAYNTPLNGTNPVNSADIVRRPRLLQGPLQRTWQ